MLPFAVVVPRVAVKPATRSGYVNGPASDNLAQFTY
jgi:hypothetical protein